MITKNILIIIIIILLLLICIYNLNPQNSKDQFQNMDESIINQIKSELANIIGFHPNRIRNISYTGDLSDQVISINLELIPHNKNIKNELSNLEIIKIIENRIKDDTLYLTINNINIKISSHNVKNLKSSNDDSFQDTNNNVNPNQLSEFVEKTGKDITRGLPFNHNLERYYEIDHIKQTLINPPELILEEESS